MTLRAMRIAAAVLPAMLAASMLHIMPSFFTRMESLFALGMLFQGGSE